MTPLHSFVPGDVSPRFADHPRIAELDKHAAGGIVSIGRDGERTSTVVRGLRVTAPAPYVGEPACYGWVVFYDRDEPIFAVGPIERLSALTAHPDRDAPGGPRCRDGVGCRELQGSGTACPRDVLYGATPLCARYPRETVEAAFADAQQRLRDAHGQGRSEEELAPLYERERQLAHAVKCWDGWAAAPLLQAGNVPARVSRGGRDEIRGGRQASVTCG
jgi:hypothetical protein